MTFVKASLGVLLVSGSLLACGGTSHDQASPGSGGSSAGVNGQAGSGGQAGGTSDASVDGPVRPDDAGHCPMAGAYPRDGGICVCQSNVPDVCGSVCVNTQTDVDHCGACDTKCPATSVCSQGKCSPPPTVLLPAPAPAATADGGAASCGPLRLATAGTTLYWTDTSKGTLNSMPGAGGTPTVIASAQMAPTFLQVVGTNIFWLNSATKTIMKSALTAGAPTPVVTAPSADAEVGGFTVSPDGQTLHFSSTKTDSSARPLGTISKVAVAGGTVTVVGSEDHGLPGAVAIDGTTIVYPVDRTGDVDAISIVAGTLAQCGLPAPGGGDDIGVDCNRLGRSQGELFVDAIFAFGGSAYWVDGSILKTELTSVPGGTFDDVATSVNSNPISAFTMDGTTSAYFTEEGSRNCHPKSTNDAGACTLFDPATPALVEKTPLTKDSSAVPLARFTDPRDPTQATRATSVAVDAAHVYYATVDCAILSATK
jgi:hypothetical protein